MPVVKQTSTKKKRYSIMVSRTQHYRFDVSATSPEAACKNLWNRLRYNNDHTQPEKAYPVMSSWADPQEQESQWLIADAAPFSELNDAAAYLWNGKEISHTTIAHRVIAYLRDHGFPV